MIKNIVRYVKSVKIAVKRAYDMKLIEMMPNSDLYFASQVNEEGYIYKANSNVCIKFNCFFACMQIVEFSTTYAVPVIHTDELFESMSEESKKFLIAHELGHFEFDKEELLNRPDELYRNDNIEYRADEFAATKYGYQVGINALTEMLDVAGYAIDNNEINKRIENLKMKSSQAC